MDRRVVVCFTTLSSKKEARDIAMREQIARPDDEVVLYNRVHPSHSPVPKKLRDFDVRIYVDCEKRVLGGDRDWY